MEILKDVGEKKIWSHFLMTQKIFEVSLYIWLYIAQGCRYLINSILCITLKTISGVYWEPSKTMEHFAKINTDSQLLRIFANSSGFECSSGFSNYLLKVNNKNIRLLWWMCSKLTIEICKWHRSVVRCFLIRHIIQILIVLAFLTLNIKLSTGCLLSSK